MLICHCRGVSEQSIRTAILAGARDLEAIGERCGAGSDCRGCLGALRALLEEHGAGTGDRDTRTSAA